MFAACVKAAAWQRGHSVMPSYAPPSAHVPHGPDHDADLLVAELGSPHIASSKPLNNPMALSFLSARSLKPYETLFLLGGAGGADAGPAPPPALRTNAAAAAHVAGL